MPTLYPSQVTRRSQPPISMLVFPSHALSCASLMHLCTLPTRRYVYSFALALMLTAPSYHLPAPLLSPLPRPHVPCHGCPPRAVPSGLCHVACTPPSCALPWPPPSLPMPSRTCPHPHELCHLACPPILVYRGCPPDATLAPIRRT